MNNLMYVGKKAVMDACMKPRRNKMALSGLNTYRISRQVPRTDER